MATAPRRDFVVTIQPFQWGRWGEVEVLDTYYAKDGADAIKQARRDMRNRGWTQQDGALKYRAAVAAKD